MEKLITLTVLAVGLAIITMFPTGAMVGAVAIGMVLLALTLTTVSGAVLALARLPVEND